MGHPLPQVLQRRSQKARHLGRSSSSVAPPRRAENRFFAGLNFAILTKSQRIPHPFMALWCNWLTRRPLKAKSPGSSPGNATKNPNKINSLEGKTKSRSFDRFWLVALWWHFCCCSTRYESTTNGCGRFAYPSHRSSVRPIHRPPPSCQLPPRLSRFGSGKQNQGSYERESDRNQKCLYLLVALPHLSERVHRFTTSRQLSHHKRPPSFMHFLILRQLPLQ
jgi:hypothetical protein